MTRNVMINRVGELIDSLKPFAYKADDPGGHGLLGELERFSNRLASGTRVDGGITMRDAHYLLTELATRQRAFCDQYSYLQSRSESTEESE